MTPTLTPPDALLESLALFQQTCQRLSEDINQLQKQDRTLQQAIAIGASQSSERISGMQAINETVVNSSGQIQRLDQSTQRIAQAVNLIRQFAAQTHLLALKASIEAARAGEEGRGFAVIAEEVRGLAAQSAEATAAIEALVFTIQTEARDVAETLNKGKQQLERENQAVKNTQNQWQQTAQSQQALTPSLQSLAQTSRQQHQLLEQLENVL